MTEVQNNSGELASRRGGLIAGGALILIGLLLLVEQLVQAEWLGKLFLPALGAIFLVWGIAVRKVGLLIPGGILGGLGLGVLLIEGPFNYLSDPARGGVFLTAFALGWGMITLFSALLRQTQWWPLIPGSVIGVVGGALLIGETTPQVLVVINALWPLSLIAIGLYIILRRK